MSLPIQDPTRTRFDSLDSLRFIAAMIALTAHAREMHDGLMVNAIADSYFFHRKSAVAFFFVLSGFVLHLSCKGAWPTLKSWTGFTIKRVFRLHPLYLASLLLALAVISLVPLDKCLWYKEDTPWRMTFDFDHSNLRQWIHHMLLVTPGIDPNFLNPPIWTLAVEMKMALIFPWVSWMMSRLSMVVGLLLTVVFMLFAPQVGNLTLPVIGLLPLFMIGAWGAQHYKKLSGWLQSRLNWRSFLLLTTGLIIYGCASMLRRYHDRDSEVQQFQAAGFGAILIMLAVINMPKLNRFLSSRALVLGGVLSYGIYVFHYPIYLGILCYTGPETASANVFYFLGLAITFVIAWILNRWLEVPMIQVGRSIADRFFSTKPKPPAQG
ncbi:MAG: acyltransferase [Verrucomicrobiota bacterium]